MTNKVDELQKEIKALQATCEHEWIVTNSDYILRESLKSGYYLGLLGSIPGPNQSFTIVCSRCSLSLNRYYTSTCPNCFKTLEPFSILDSRLEDYIDDKYNQYGYYAIRLSYCPNKDFAIANLEFDQ